MNSKTIYIKAQNTTSDIDRSYFVPISSDIAHLVYGEHDMMRGYYEENYITTHLSTILNLPMDTRFEVRVMGSTVRMNFYTMADFIASHYRCLYETTTYPKEGDRYYDNF